MQITAPATQLLTGSPVAESRCSYCKTTLQDGKPVGAYAVQYAGDDAWLIPRLYCEGCCPNSITTATLGTTQLLVTGRLASTMDTAAQQVIQTLTNVELITVSQPEVGDV